MARPNHTTGAAQIYSRLSGDLVSTYAKGVWRDMVPAEDLPAVDDKPVVVITQTIDMTDTTFGENVGRADIVIYVIRHAHGSASDLDTVVTRIVGDNSTYGIDRWAPTVSGIGTTPIQYLDSGGLGSDPDHVSHEIRFQTWYSEASA